jgi:outer membrane receptor protein involved in Fe transport
MLRTWALSCASLVLGYSGPGAHAAEAPHDAPIATAPAAAVGEIDVWGKREDRIGAAVSASEGLVSYGAFAQRPLLRPGELAEVIPGLAVTQHSGSGKANQYFLRGFNLDHGTDFSVALDGVPLNLRTHAHGQGYLDLNAVTPEMVQTIGYHKGPYYADAGDFSAAGAATFNTFSHLPNNFVQLQGGEHEFGRIVGAYNLGHAGLFAADLTVGNGPWETKERLRKGSLLGRFNAGDWSITALAYGARWNSTDQIPQRAVENGQISALGSIDPPTGAKPAASSCRRGATRLTLMWWFTLSITG